MSENLVKKVIRASAGTGKTYRLSLEYIALLLKFRGKGIHFSEILVITFTKKATAEIRERIFEHLAALIDGSELGKELYDNLKAILSTEVTPDDLTYLRRIFQEMLLNKNSVQISTIDSFTQSIFKSIILPYWGLSDFKIDNNLTDDLLAEIYQFILENKDHLGTIINLFQRSGRKKIEDYNHFIKSILESRWAFHLIEQSDDRNEDQARTQAAIDASLKSFRNAFDQALGRFQTYLATDQIHLPLQDILKRDYYALFVGNRNEVAAEDLAGVMKAKLADEIFLRREQKTLLKAEPFWNGSKLLRKQQHKELGQELKVTIQEAAGHLADYFLYTQLLPEEKEIAAIAKLVFEKYDAIKFRDRTFTYSDITYYTFKYLYDPRLSLIERDSVTNAFYEYLSSRTRFVMIDEFQDTSIIQFKILLPIIQELISGIGAKEYGGVIVVGDEKQSMYGWRGGERDLLQQLPIILSEPEKITLLTSYRSEEKIIEFVNAVFTDPGLHEKLSQQNIVWPYEPAVAKDQRGEGFVQINLRNYAVGGDDENDFSQQQDTLREMAERIVYPLIRDGKILPRETAILARKNSDLSFIAEVLDEYGIPYILESSSSVLQHRAIRPMMYLLRYFVYNDFYDLLRFLRSDYVLMDAVELKEVLWAYRETTEQNGSSIALFAKAKGIPAIDKIARIAESAVVLRMNARQSATGQVGELLPFIKTLLEEYDATGLFALESDAQNIIRFLELLAAFENFAPEYAKSLKGFLDYCDDHESDEEFQQPELGAANAIRLLTIHKAKGLEFANVFLYWNLSARSGHESGRLHHYLNFVPDFSRLHDYALTFNFDHVLPLCSRKHLSEREEAREAIEELNNIYVAITRAKKNLFVYCAYKKAGGFDDLIEEIQSTESPEVDKLLVAAINQILANGFSLGKNNQHSVLGTLGRLSDVKELPESQALVEFPFIRRYLHVDPSAFLALDKDRLEKERFADWKTIYIKNRAIDKGNVAHYYLSFVKHGSESERKNAALHTISFYGNLFVPAEIKDIVQKVDAFIKENSSVFDAEAWPKVFTELTLFSPKGREVRLDRLMVNERKREILIVDYKTGELYDAGQLEEYIAAVIGLPIVKQEGYRVSGRFLELEL